MKKWITPKNMAIFIGAWLVFIGGYTVLNRTFGWFDSPEVERQDTFRKHGPVRIVKIVPEALECRAYVQAEIPVKGESQYIWKTPLFSKTLNTDTITFTAIGDVEVCFPAEGATVHAKNDGSWLVEIDSSQAVFNRPRVDALATENSVDYKPGAGREIIEFVPIVDYFIDTNAHELTAEAFAYAQALIGGSDCMNAAWQPVQKAIVLSYQDQAARKGADPGAVEVIFTNQPDFEQHAKVFDTGVFDGVEFEIDTENDRCVVLEDALPAS